MDRHEFPSVKACAADASRSAKESMELMQGTERIVSAARVRAGEASALASRAEEAARAAQQAAERASGAAKDVEALVAEMEAAEGK